MSWIDPRATKWGYVRKVPAWKIVPGLSIVAYPVEFTGEVVFGRPQGRSLGAVLSAVTSVAVWSDLTREQSSEHRTAEVPWSDANWFAADKRLVHRGVPVHRVSISRFGVVRSIPLKPITGWRYDRSLQFFRDYVRREGEDPPLLNGPVAPASEIDVVTTSRDAPLRGW